MARGEGGDGRGLEVSERSKQAREHEVMAALRKSRWVSVFWLQNPCTRWAALDRLERRGVVSVKVMEYPMYRVTIHRAKEGGK